MSGQWDRSASSWGRQARGSGLDSWLGLATQMMFLPFRMLGWGMQAMTGTGQELQSLGDSGGCNRGPCGSGGWPRGLGDSGGYNRAGWTGAQDWRRPAAPPPPVWPAPASTQSDPQRNPGTGDNGAAGAIANPAETRRREEKDMACDKDLSGTDLKVVEYSIVSVSPNIQNDTERLLYGPTVVTTTEDMTESDFTAWVIALYLQAKFEGPERDVYVRRPKIAHNDKQYLRVCYCVQCRMSIPDVNYQKKQADALDSINRTLEERLRPKGGEEGGSNLPDKAR